MKIVLTGGGTGGHVTPNLALIPELDSRGFDIVYIGEYEGPEKELTRDLPVRYCGISSGKLRRYFDLKNFTDPFRVLKGYFESVRILRKEKPVVLFSKGGFVSVPVVYAARRLRIPVVTHESDLTPGLANKLAVPCAKTVCCTFQHAADMVGEKGVYTGTPLRPDLFRGSRARGLEKFSLAGDRPVLMVTGGSSGAQAINTLVRSSLPDLLATFQVLHLCGKGNLDPTLIGADGYAQVEYLDSADMADAYACADIIVSRAGANTLCELTALRIPTLLIPYPREASRGDQILNAREFEKKGLARVLMQEDASPEKLQREVTLLYKTREEYITRMKKEPSANGLENVLKEILKAAGLENRL